LPPCCSLLCLECPLFCWRQLLVVLFIGQKPLHNELQSEPYNINNIHTRNIMKILFFAEPTVTWPLTASLGALVFTQVI
jgi:hypothetical protein